MGVPMPIRKGMSEFDKMEELRGIIQQLDLSVVELTICRRIAE